MAHSLRVLIIPDKFKGTLTAGEAASAIAAGWLRARAGDTLDVVPMSDGGDGFGEVIGGLFGAERRSVATVDADHSPVTAQWWWHKATQTAVIESAEVIGLARVGAGDPLRRDTFGLGAVLLGLPGAARTLIGVGGSATNDGGFGVARALGRHFFDATGELERWTDLDRLERIEPPPLPSGLGAVTVAVDVRNPLLGPEGCSAVFGPQKGLLDLEAAEARLARLAEVVGGDLSRQPGTGAAGGLGFGLAAFVGAALRPGFEVFAEAAGLEERMDRADLVITGEGSLDAQTLMGKGVGEVAGMARTRGIPCVAMVGRVGGDFGDAFAAVHAIDGLQGARDALKLAAERVAVAWPKPKAR